MLKRFFISLPLVIVGCGSAQQEPPPVTEAKPVPELYKTIGAIKEPVGFKRDSSTPGSFSAWLRTIPLKKDNTVYLYNGKRKRNQYAQFAVLDISVGDKDLQQCADAVMRLRAEYLYAQKRYSAISFMDYGGKWYNWSGNDNRPAFDNYLQTVFGWCGSASLEKQLKPVARFNDLKAGDVFVHGGFPGHAMIVADIAVNEKGEKIFMLVQGYQPAQDIHVVINPNDNHLSPWYIINDEDEISTPGWTFYKKELRTW
jgi:Domain of unknown function (4846)